jgi:hypothetical protein
LGEEEILIGVVKRDALENGQYVRSAFGIRGQGE